MKSVKRALVLLLTGFLAFAPPGTMIFGVALILTLTDSVGLALGGVLITTILVVIWLLYTRSSRKPDA
jgi:multisubunit Na+/H+ antiporter MnhB subunit